MSELQVLILSLADFTDKSGGTRYNLHFLQTLQRLSGVRFTVVSMGSESIRVANDERVRSFGMEHAFVPWRPQPSFEGGWMRRSLRVARAALTVVSEKYFFHYEREARRQWHVDAECMRILEATRPDVVVLVYLFAALFVPSIFKLDIPRCMVTVNNEAEFQRGLRSHGGPVGDRLHERLGRWLFRRGNWLANRRVANFERRIYSSCTGLVALTPTDLPPGLPRQIEQAIIPPILVQSAPRWHYQGTRHAFFVGTISYYPNRMAVEWLCTRFAPELQRLDPTVRIDIIGADTQQVPPEWVRPNINLMGYSTREEVIRQMTTADLFIAPIANNFGAKLKLAECVSYGMPLLATRAAMSGLLFLRSMPEIDLEQPQQAARLALDLIDSPARLRQLHESITEQTSQARALEAQAWGSFLRRLSRHRQETRE